jgi:hypothetical protein
LPLGPLGVPYHDGSVRHGDLHGTDDDERGIDRIDRSTDRPVHERPPSEGHEQLVGGAVEA